VERITQANAKNVTGSVPASRAHSIPTATTPKGNALESVQMNATPAKISATIMNVCLNVGLALTPTQIPMNANNVIKTADLIVLAPRMPIALVPLSVKKGTS
jgi:hypothetical protein